MKKNSIILLLLIIFAFPLSAADSQNDGIYLNMTKEYRLAEDGSWTYHYSSQLRILTYYSHNRRYGETFIVYNPLYQKLKINRSITTMVNGKEYPSPANAYNEVLPGFAANSASYNHLREMVVTHIAMEPGAVIDLDYEISSNAEFLPGFMGDETLAEDSPINELIIRVIIPSAKKLKYHLFNSDLQPLIKTENNQKIFEWKLSNLPAVNNQVLKPLTKAFMPNLVFSSFDNWEDAALPFKNGYAEELPAGIIDKVADQSRTPLQQILSIQEAVVNNIATLNIPFSATGYHFRSTKQTWESSGGTPFEKAQLMANLFRLAGFPSNVLLVNDLEKIPENVPSLNGFNHVFISVRTNNNQTLFLSPETVNQQSLDFKFGGYPAIAIDEDGARQTVIAKTKMSENNCLVGLNIKLDETKHMTGKITISLSGQTNPYLNILRNNKDVNKLFASYQTENSEIQHLSPETTTAAAGINDTVTLDEHGDYSFFYVPDYPYGFASFNIPTLSVTRLVPVNLPVNHFKETFDISLELPASMIHITPEKQIIKKNRIGELKIQIRQSGQMINYSRSLELYKKKITVDDYPDFLQLWRLWENPGYKQLIFKKSS